MKDLFLKLTSTFLFLVSISMFIPTPSSTEENYEISGFWIVAQIVLFTASRALIMNRKLWWVTIFEVVGFALITIVFRESYNFITAGL